MKQICMSGEIYANFNENSLPYTSVLTGDKLQKMLWTTLEHSSYSPFFFCKYHIFGLPKKTLGDHEFDHDIIVQTCFEKHFHSMISLQKMYL